LLLTGLLFSYLFSFLVCSGRRSAVAVVVLGDIGRSPRMQYHCGSLADLPGTVVHIVAFRGERCVPSLEGRANVVPHLLGTPFGGCPRRLFLLYAPLKVAWQVAQLLFTLLWIPAPRAVLVQNPPSIPTLAAVWCVCALRGSRMVIDWHNFGYTILGLSLGEGHPLVTVSRLHERLCARRASAHLCVTNAMRLWLLDTWGVRARLLYDRPPPFFRAAQVSEKHDLFCRLAQQLPSPPPSASGGGVAAPGKAVPRGRARSGARPASPLEQRQRTLVTHVDARTGSPVLSPSRPAVLVSSTSWTADEDFGMLLRALQALDAAISLPRRRASFPDFLVLITGKGPLKEDFERLAEALKLQRVSIRTLWLSPSDYPLLLGSADCGISLHASSSGLDLPMKVVDMFGAGLPVCALGFSCLPELVQHDINGLIFRNEVELEGQLEDLFEGFPDKDPSLGRLARLRKGVAASLQSRWEENWLQNAKPLFE